MKIRLARDRGAERGNIYGKARNAKVGWMLRSLLFLGHCSLAYSALACCKIGTSGSASFQSVRKPSYALFALALFPDEVYALPSCKCASAPMGSAPTIPR